MRLWHRDLLPRLDRQRLLGQHRECCALRGLGWGRKHATVDYVFGHDYFRLFAYHVLVMRLLEKAGVEIAGEWWDPEYRGKRANATMELYPEHDAEYLEECVENLKRKGFNL